VRSPFSNRACHSRHAPTLPCRCSAVGPLVRDRARAFAAQVMGFSRATPHHLGLLHSVWIKIEVLDLLRASGEDERRAPPWCAPVGIEPPAHLIATALFLCSALLSPARYGLITAACCDARAPASDPVPCPTAARCVVGRLRTDRQVDATGMWQCGNVASGRVGGRGRVGGGSRARMPAAVRA
jgi:hypothetical protein